MTIPLNRDVSYDIQDTVSQANKPSSSTATVASRYTPVIYIRVSENFREVTFAHRVESKECISNDVCGDIMRLLRKKHDGDSVRVLTKCVFK